jgi:hypothetical protein
MNCCLALLLFLFTLSAANALSQQTTPDPTIEGYVTHVISPTDFDVNGTHIHCNNGTQFGTSTNGVRHLSPAAKDLYIGEPLDVFGTLDRKARTITADEAIANTPQPQQLNGTAIIDGISGKQPGPGERLLRADGYLILITAKTHSVYTKPLVSLFDVGTNVWVRYSGKQRPDGIVEADTAAFAQNAIPKDENKLRTKNEYDPKAVDPSLKQNDASKLFFGFNPMEIPPYDDAAMQSRIERIGASLVPAYQRHLPVDDKTKINFRFQLVDEPKWRTAMPLPNGIILVSRQIVDRMENDSQLATILADNIAWILEKQDYRGQPAKNEIAAAKLVSLVGGGYLFGATTAVTKGIAATLERHAEDQSGRVSLVLLHDAGYNILEAPHAWWLAAPKKPTTMSATDPPLRAVNLYKTIGTTWRVTSPTN